MGQKKDEGYFEKVDQINSQSSTVVFQPTLIQNHFLTLIEFFTVSDLSNLIHYICDTFR